MIDTHCHLDFPEFSLNLESVLDAAKQVGVDEFIVPATDKKNWQAVRALSVQYPQIEVAYGIHPWFLDDNSEADLTALSAWVETHPCVAIGECGLDFYHGRADEVLQSKVFAFQLDLARQHSLPVIVHSRKAVEAVLLLCKKHQISQGVLHGFAGSIEQARQAINMGLYIGVGGVICNEKSTKIRKMVQGLPLDKILLETDSTGQVSGRALTLRQAQGAGQQACSQNEVERYSLSEVRRRSLSEVEGQGTPADIVPIAHALAALHGVSFETVVVQCTANAKACFKS